MHNKEVCVGNSLMQNSEGKIKYILLSVGKFKNSNKEYPAKFVNMSTIPKSHVPRIPLERNYGRL